MRKADQAREERLAQALRDNLRRRKARDGVTPPLPGGALARIDPDTTEQPVAPQPRKP